MFSSLRSIAPFPLALALFFGLTVPAYAVLYAPGETLDPACAPGDVDCGVTSPVGEGVQGQVPYYAADGSVVSATSSITILQNGNVGIGTTSPAANLGIVGSIGVSSTHLYLTESGKVAIGTSTPDSFSTLSLFASGGPVFSLYGPNGSVQDINYASGGVAAWTLRSTNRGSGSNEGSDFVFRSRSDAGSNLGDRLIIKRSNGNVGVATSTPYARLSVRGAGTTTGINFQTTNSSNAPLFTILDSGSVGVATTTPSQKFTVAGTVGFPSLTASVGAGSLCLTVAGEVVHNSGTDNCLSSTRATKHSIDTLSLSSLSMIEDLEPVSFIYNGDPREQVRYGFIAEDASAVDAHLVTMNAQGGISGLDTSGFLALIVSAVQELSERLGNFAKSITSERGTFELLCVGSTCVTESELKGLLDNANQPSVYIAPPPPVEVVPEEVVPVEGVEPEVSEEPVDVVEPEPVEEPAEEPVVQPENEQTEVPVEPEGQESEI